MLFHNKLEGNLILVMYHCASISRSPQCRQSSPDSSAIVLANEMSELGTQIQNSVTFLRASGFKLVSQLNFANSTYPSHDVASQLNFAQFIRA
jgi:hypothetical protein